MNMADKTKREFQSGSVKGAALQQSVDRKSLTRDVESSIRTELVRLRSAV